MGLMNRIIDWFKGGSGGGNGAIPLDAGEAELLARAELARRMAIQPAAMAETDPFSQTMTINMGPQHPSTHGVLRLIVELDGERVRNVGADIGYLHTGIEKTMESKSYLKAIPCTDRMSYLGPLHNNLAYVLAIEKLMEVEVPPRAQWARVILCELDRLASHLVYLASNALDLGAMSVFLYAFREREKIIDIMEMCSGARMMTSYYRPGGLALPLPDGFEEAVKKVVDIMPGALDEYHALLTNNPIWLERTKGVGILTQEDAIKWAATGPILRATGVNWDLRKVAPYAAYDQVEFDVALGSNGDCYDRYMVRMEEMRQSVRIIQQGLAKLPPGPHITNNRKVAPPPKEELAYSMESLIHHFKIWTEGIKPPPGEVYAAVEAPRGEIGFYVVSDGTARGRRIHMRSPSFVHCQMIPLFCQGSLVADLVAIIASLDPVLGEVDR